MSHINEMGTGSSVYLIFSINGKEIAKETKITGILDPKYGEGIMCDLVTHYGKVLNCSIGLINVRIDDNKTGDEFVFKQLKVANVMQQNTLVIYSSEDVKPSDQRQATRFQYRCNASFRVRAYAGTLSGQVEDISVNGIGCFIRNNNVMLNKGDDIFIKFDDYINQPGIVGKIMRVIPHSSDYIFVGIYVENASNVMTEIIHEAKLQGRG